MVAIQIMLCVFGVIIAVAVISKRCLYAALGALADRHGRATRSGLRLGDDPPGFKQLRAELREKNQQR